MKTVNKKEIKELIHDIQTGGEKEWWNMVHDFPDSMKGSCAVQVWNDSNFSYGTEYGALIVLNHLLKKSELGENSE